MWRNSTNGYGLVSIGLHWLIAVTVLALFGLGLWMTELTYYDPWYQRAPDIHKSIGVLLFGALLVRLVWRLANPVPEPEGTPHERIAAVWAHRLLYLILFAQMLAGYLISTADGRPISVFGWFEVPATLHGFENQEDIAGEIHEILAFTLIALALLHALAALKHHWFDRDQTLMRMLRVKHRSTNT
jgi:cytochrome b561